MRKLYKEEELKDIILFQKPYKVQLQSNKEHVLFYKYVEENLKIVLSIEMDVIRVITFYLLPIKRI